MAEKAISLPFRIDQYGKIAEAITQEKIWADRVRGVLGTTFRERVLRPEFGASIVESLFGEAYEETLELTRQVEDAFSTFLPELTLVSVNVSDDFSTGAMTIEITYQLPNEKETSINIGFVDIVGTLPPIQQLAAYQEITNE